MTGKYEDAGANIGRLVQRKNAAYGDSFTKACEVLIQFYPDGVQPPDYKILLAFARIIDKLFRIATDKNAFGEEPWKDIAGYCLLSLAVE